MKHILIICLSFCLIGCQMTKRFDKCLDVNGGQGVYRIGDDLYINGSAQISLYYKDHVVKQNKDVFTTHQGRVNHMGALSGDKEHLYAPIEYFDGSSSQNLQVGIYNRHTLMQTSFFALNKKSAQRECSAIAYDDRDHSLWLSEWGDNSSSYYLYHYTCQGKYLSKKALPHTYKWIQGLSVYKGNIYIACDDGDANKDEPDHIYCLSTQQSVLTLDDVYDQGEIEGISITSSGLDVLYNRGAKVTNGKVVGLEKGYSKQLHEVYHYPLSALDINV